MPYGTSGGVLSEVPDNLFGTAQVSVTHPAIAAEVVIVGTGNSDMNPANGGFVSVLDKYTEIVTVGPHFTVQSDGRVQINTSGTVTITGYADVSHSANNATVGTAFEITRDGTSALSARSVHAKVPNNGDIGNISGGGVLSALAGDIVGIALASDISGTLNIKASSLIFAFKAQ